MKIPAWTTRLEICCQSFLFRIESVYVRWPWQHYPLYSLTCRATIFLNSGTGSSESCTHAAELNRPEQPAERSSFAQKNVFFCRFWCNVLGFQGFRSHKLIKSKNLHFYRGDKNPDCQNPYFYRDDKNWFCQSSFFSRGDKNWFCQSSFFYRGDKNWFCQINFLSWR